jgi:hypothetical protein
LSVITPPPKAGGYRMAPAAESRAASTASGAGITVKISPELLGYERSTYAVAGSAPGVTVKFSSAEAIRDGKTEQATAPAATLFSLPRGERRVRLIYLWRSSRVERHVAVVSAKDAAVLQQLTLALQRDPAGACKSSRAVTGEWIPPGIAVRPEKPNGADWVPGR